MTKQIRDIDSAVLAEVRRGTVIPAQPLALDSERRFSPRHQRALCRYYIDAGAGGIAVGVHSTQFEIRKPEIGLFEPVLRETAGFIDEWCARRTQNPEGRRHLRPHRTGALRSEFRDRLRLRRRAGQPERLRQRHRR